MQPGEQTDQDLLVKKVSAWYTLGQKSTSFPQAGHTTSANCSRSGYVLFLRGCRRLGVDRRLGLLDRVLRSQTVD
jgi:hypothetical protein